ncbi:MAG: hypothetical protein HOP29_06225 [Phycisphaerales bacterium]|nr:hypothetical protein [Phycisphaerales bacterium]
MSSVMRRRKRVQSLVTVVVAALVLVGGCSDTGGPGPASDFGQFAVDFAREALAAWLL